MELSFTTTVQGNKGQEKTNPLVAAAMGCTAKYTVWNGEDTNVRLHWTARFVEPKLGLSFKPKGTWAWYGRDGDGMTPHVTCPILPDNVAVARVQIRCEARLGKDLIPAAVATKDYWIRNLSNSERHENKKGVWKILKNQLGNVNRTVYTGIGVNASRLQVDQVYIKMINDRYPGTLVKGMFSNFSTPKSKSYVEVLIDEAKDFLDAMVQNPVADPYTEPVDPASEPTGDDTIDNTDTVDDSPVVQVHPLAEIMSNLQFQIEGLDEVLDDLQNYFMEMMEDK